MTLEADITEALEACRSDLTRVVDELKWALSTALAPGKALDPPGSVDDGPVGEQLETEPVDADNPDTVPGARWALDIGDFRLRQAFLVSVELLAAAELRTMTALYVLGTCPQQPALCRPTDRSTVSSFTGLEITLRWRFDRIQHDMGLVPRRALRLADRHLQGRFRKPEPPSARQALDQAFRNLTSAFARGKTEIATAERMCIICGIRPRGDRKSRCDTCAKWKLRNKSERPTSIDEQVIGAAKLAAERRAERGEGFGVG